MDYMNDITTMYIENLVQEDAFERLAYLRDRNLNVYSFLTIEELLYYYDAVSKNQYWPSFVSEEKYLDLLDEYSPKNKSLFRIQPKKKVDSRKLNLLSMDNVQLRIYNTHNPVLCYLDMYDKTGLVKGYTTVSPALASSLKKVIQSSAQDQTYIIEAQALPLVYAYMDKEPKPYLRVTGIARNIDSGGKGIEEFAY